MFIKNIHIDSFGGIRNVSLELAEGLNIIEGKNESGKSSVAMFIKFVLYGLSGRSVDGALSERRRYVNWETGSAAGYIVLNKDGTDYKIERELYVSSSDTDGTTAEAVRERVSVTDEKTGQKLFRGQIPGAALLGMPEQMFYNTVFVRQLTDASIDGTGMAEAVENILYSGDESVSTRRAAERLDKSRKILLHKNGNGGRIYDLRRERLALEAELEAARERNSEIIDIEGSIADSSALIEAREKQAKRLSDVFTASEKMKEAEKLDELEKWEKEEKRLKILLESYPPREETEAVCDDMRKKSMERGEVELRLKAIRMRIASLDDALPPIMSEADMEAERGDITAARAAEAKKKTCFRFSLALFILAALCACGGVFLLRIDLGLSVAAFCTAGVMAAAGAVLLVLSLSALKKLNALLDKREASSVDDIEAIINDSIARNSMLRSDESEYGELVREEISAAAEREELLSQQRILASGFTEDEPDTDTMTEKALQKAAVTIKEIAAYTREYDIVLGKLSMLGRPDASQRELIRREAKEAAESEAGRTASKLSQTEKDKLERDRGFYFSTAEAQRRRHMELEKKLSALTANAVSPSEIAGRIEIIDRELSELQQQLNGLIGAMDALQRAGEGLRASLLPRVVSEAGVLLGAFTGGKYTGLGVDRDFSMSFTPGGYTRESDYMSAGTRDAAYISLRSALMKVLFPEGSPPAVYDESFARIDEPRLERLLSILQAAGEDGSQSLVFTCRSLEAKISGAQVPVIKL